MPKAAEIAAFADSLLRTHEIPDYPNALNGLQVGTDAEISKLGAAVDFSARAVGLAAKAGVNLLLVHHGAFWDGLAPITGRRLRVLSDLLSASIGVYSSHLPLDCHPVLGNNVLLAQRLGLVPESPFGKFNEISIGTSGHSACLVSELLDTATTFAQEHGGHVHSTPFRTGRNVGRWAICTGAGADSDTLREAGQRGIETLIVGEGPHWTAVRAEESGLVLIYAGHYVTETLGVQALAAAISAEFRIPWEFIAAPTGT
ncbi:MAG TPA: Nif3-like dinuclear metal center hexameric protein [Thermoanaerobaculia bacterium]|nr:Nif3-like dinuclear metal center hexameric protein [Thermoanaerobaculia bacterium]